MAIKTKMNEAVIYITKFKKQACRSQHFFPPQYLDGNVYPGSLKKNKSFYSFEYTNKFIQNLLYKI